MKYGIPDLCRKSRIGDLSGDQINWVEHQLRHLPYFQLHQIILAHQEHQVPSGSPCIEKGLLFSTNRKAMAALMIQDPDMDLFIPSPENRISEPAENPEPTLKDIPEPQPALDIETPPVVNETSSVEETPQPALLIQTLGAESVDTSETPEPQSQPVAQTITETPEPEITSPAQVAESIAQTEAPEPEPSIAPEPPTRPVSLSLSASEQKLDHKIKFRLQMFDWKIALIRKQLREKAGIPSGGDSAPKTPHRDERIAPTPNLTWAPDTDWLKEEIAGSFDPDLPVSEIAEPISVKPPSDTRLPEFIEVEYQPQPAWQSSNPDSDSGAAPEQENTQTGDILSENQESGIVTLRHNQLVIDIEVNSPLSAKWLKKKEAPATESPQPKTKTTNFRKRPDRHKVLEIIDKFIESEPEISIRPKLTDGKQEDISRRSVTDEGELVSETLAQIYLKQGNKTRAIRIYENLKLKFPEKSAYFESLLQKIH